MFPTFIEFKIVALSDNTNSFGLRGHIMVAQNGLAYKAGANAINTKKEGSIVRVPQYQTGFDHEGAPKLTLNWAELGFEIPQRIADAPDDLVDIAWSRKA